MGGGGGVQQVVTRVPTRRWEAHRENQITVISPGARGKTHALNLGNQNDLSAMVIELKKYPRNLINGELYIYI